MKKFITILLCFMFTFIITNKVILQHSMMCPKCGSNNTTTEATSIKVIDKDSTQNRITNKDFKGLPRLYELYCHDCGVELNITEDDVEEMKELEV